jgi:hypothetical protein
MEAMNAMLELLLTESGLGKSIESFQNVKDPNPCAVRRQLSESQDRLSE